jgi:UDP-glucose 4-epimerase
MTGATGDLGKLLLPLLEADPRVESLLALDVVRPSSTSEKLTFKRLDLARHDAEAELSAVLAEQRIDALYHLAFQFGPVLNGALAHELEVIGTNQVLTAVAQAGIGKLIVPSVTAVYGARPQNPAFLEEDAVLQGCPASRFVSDKIEVERQLRAFRPRHPETKVVVLRFAPILGPTVDNPVTRFLQAPLVPTLLGFDPLWQALHEEDAGRALHAALHADVDGEFNVVGKGVLPLSGMIRLAGGRVLPVPHPMARGAVTGLNAVGTLSIPLPLLDYIHFSWVADGRKAERALGYAPRHHARDAVAALRRA